MIHNLTALKTNLKRNHLRVLGDLEGDHGETATMMIEVVDETVIVVMAAEMMTVEDMVAEKYLVVVKVTETLDAEMMTVDLVVVKVTGEVLVGVGMAVWMMIVDLGTETKIVAMVDMKMILVVEAEVLGEEWGMMEEEVVIVKTRGEVLEGNYYKCQI